jgi:hypothetical protein
MLLALATNIPPLKPSRESSNLTNLTFSISLLNFNVPEPLLQDINSNVPIPKNRDLKLGTRLSD